MPLEGMSLSNYLERIILRMQEHIPHHPRDEELVDDTELRLLPLMRSELVLVLTTIYVTGI
jgi:hypothetical protein